MSRRRRSKKQTKTMNNPPYSIEMWSYLSMKNYGTTRVIHPPELTEVMPLM